MSTLANIKMAELESEMIVLAAHADQLLDRPIEQFERRHADDLDRLAMSLSRAATQIRISNPRPSGSIGRCVQQRQRTESARRW